MGKKIQAWTRKKLRRKRTREQAENTMRRGGERRAVEPKGNRRGGGTPKGTRR